MVQQIGAGCPKCGSELDGEVYCPFCEWNLLVETWLPRLREAIQCSLYNCTVARRGRHRWIVSVVLVDAASWTWAIRVEEAKGKVLTGTQHYADLRAALEYHPGLTSLFGWQPLERVSARRSDHLPTQVLGEES